MFLYEHYIFLGVNEEIYVPILFLIHKIKVYTFKFNLIYSVKKLFCYIFTNIFYFLGNTFLV